MTFIWPDALYLLILIPVCVLIYLQFQHRRKRIAERSGGFGLAEAAGQKAGSQRHIPPGIFLFAMAVMIFALSRPQAVISLPRMEGTVILAFDVSGSMAADDIKPTRMDAAKAAASDFIKHVPPTVQVGVVAFSDSGFSVQTPTIDQSALLAAIDRLTPQRGTSLANGIQASLNTLAADQGQPSEIYSNLLTTPSPTPTPVPQGTYTSAVIVLLTDGENNESPDPLAAAQMAADRGVRIYTIGIGSAAGTNVHINGFILHTQLDEGMLKQISQISGGTYFSADNAPDLRKIYDNLEPQLMVKPEQTELTSLFAGAGLLAFLVGGMFSLLWFGRIP